MRRIFLGPARGLTFATRCVKASHADFSVTAPIRTDHKMIADHTVANGEGDDAEPMQQ